MLEPLDDRVFVKKAESQKITAGGIALPDVAQKDPWRGVVVAAGPGRVLDSGERLEPSVKVGDTVLLAKYMGVEIEEDGQRLLALRESDILAIVKKGKSKKWG